MVKIKKVDVHIPNSLREEMLKGGWLYYEVSSNIGENIGPKLIQIFQLRSLIQYGNPYLYYK